MTINYRKNFIVPKKLKKGSLKQRRLTTSKESGYELLELMRERLGLNDYSQSSVLDLGCGTRIIEAIIGKNIPIKKYIGMDVDRELIEFLKNNIKDPHLEFYHIDLFNRMYNKAGKQLTLSYRLPVEETFNIICLFSVFTHFDPLDTDCMLSILRHYADDSTKLIFTCFLDNTVSGFDDRNKKTPLSNAVYTEVFFRHLIERNEWNIKILYTPTKAEKNYWLMQHCFICTPKIN